MDNSCVGNPEDCISDHSGTVAAISNISDTPHTNGAVIACSPMTPSAYAGSKISVSGRGSYGIDAASTYLLNVTLRC